MSFSSDLKEELSKINNLNKKDEVKAEFIGYITSKNASIVKRSVRYATESEYNINRYSKLLKNLDINNKIEYDGKSFIIFFNLKFLPDEVIVNENKLEINDKYQNNISEKINQNQIQNNIEKTKNSDNIFEKNKNIESKIKINILENENCKRAFVRGTFLGSGSINNPNAKYHLTIELSTTKNAQKLYEILKELDINCKMLEKSNMIYLKDGEEISKLIALMGANKSVLEFEDIRVKREMSGKINRIVNCKTANLNKILNTSVEQINAIKKLKENGQFNKLDDNLKEIAEIRLEYPDLPLAELGKKLKNPVGKSGVNYRLKKIVEISKECD